MGPWNRYKWSYKEDKMALQMGNWKYNPYNWGMTPITVKGLTFQHDS